MHASARLVAMTLISVLAAACGKQEAPPAPKAEAPKAVAAPAAPEPLKVGFVYVSPVGDAGWTSQHHLGRGEMLKALGDKVTSTYVEKVPEGADAERVIRDLAQQGHKLIFTTSFGFMNPTLKVAEEFKDVKFEHATGYKTAANVNTYNARFYEGRYLAGMIAGRMTKTNTLGYVAAFPIPEVLQGINAFATGARSVNPKAQVRVVWVNTWYDPGKERDAASALMGQGADVVTHHTDSTATVAAAEEKGRMAVAYHSNMAKFGPNAQTGRRHASLGRLLHAARAGGARWNVEGRAGVGRHPRGHDQARRPVGQAAEGRGRRGEGARGRAAQGRLPSVHRPGPHERRQGRRRRAAR